MSSLIRLAAVHDRFFTTNVGGTLFLKTCSFVQEQHARIVDVDENRLKIRVGHTWMQRLLYRVSNDKPAEIQLRIHRDASVLLSEEERMRLPGISCSQIQVTITPRSPSWDHGEFQQFARRMLWDLRQHFVAP